METQADKCLVQDLAAQGTEWKPDSKSSPVFILNNTPLPRTSAPPGLQAWGPSALGILHLPQAWPETMEGFVVPVEPWSLTVPLRSADDSPPDLVA